MKWFAPRTQRVETKSLAEPDADLLAVFGIAPAGGVGVSPTIALTVPAVGAAIRVISEACATLDRRIIRSDPEGQHDDAEHPVSRMLHGDVNDWTSAFELVRDLVAEALTRDVGGMAWINRVDGKPVEIIQYKAGAIGVKFEKTGEPRYTIGDMAVPATDIIHIRGPFAKCPLTQFRDAIGAAHHMERYAGNFFRNSARPGGYIEYPGKRGDTALKNIRDGWAAANDGPENSGRTAVLWDGAKWVPMTLTSADSQFLELRRFQIEEIARAFNIPAPMIGDLTRATWSNLESKNREFLSYTLEPWLCTIEAAFNRALFTSEERKTYRFILDRDDLTRASLTERATAISSLRASKVLSSNEARNWLELPPTADGDTLENPNIEPTNGAENGHL